MSIIFPEKIIQIHPIACLWGEVMDIFMGSESGLYAVLAIVTSNAVLCYHNLCYKEGWMYLSIMLLPLGTIGMFLMLSVCPTLRLSICLTDHYPGERPTDFPSIRMEYTLHKQLTQQKISKKLWKDAKKGNKI